MFQRRDLNRIIERIFYNILWGNSIHIDTKATVYTHKVHRLSVTLVIVLCTHIG